MSQNFNQHFCTRKNHWVLLEDLVNANGKVLKTCRECSNARKLGRSSVVEDKQDFDATKRTIALEDFKLEVANLANIDTIAYKSFVDMEINICHQNESSFVIALRDALHEATGFFFMYVYTL